MRKTKVHTEYAIVDIETTGGNASGSRITEIAILIHDGMEVVERFESLVNPEKNIPLPIFALTGIDNAMVKDAPIFGDIAEQVYKLLNDRVFVAHNVNFDYSFVKHQLEQEGFKWTANKLCTVRMSRKIKPGLRSYSLGNLCKALGVPIENRHRAGGDADATAILFSRLLEWDTEDVIPEMLKRNSKEQQLPPHLPKEDFEALPNCPGVYYFRDRIGKPIYVGKAVNLKKRVSSHFTGHNPNPQRQHFLRNIYSITFERCATELMAFLLECAEIRRLWPTYNRALKRFEPKYGLFSYLDISGYRRLAVGKLSKGNRCLKTFSREYDAVTQLSKLIRDFDLCPKLCSFGYAALPYRDVTVPEPEHDMTIREPPDTYNTKVQQAIDIFLAKQPSFAIIDKGRHREEKSLIWVEQGELYGMGYLDTYSDLSRPEDIRDSLTRYESNYYMMQLIYGYVEKYPGKIIRFE